MAKSFKYRVCQVQMARVTFVNGHWQGLQIPEDSSTEELYNSCPMVWDYLEAAGRDGWELPTLHGVDNNRAASLERLGQLSHGSSAHRIEDETKFLPVESVLNIRV